MGDASRSNAAYSRQKQKKPIHKDKERKCFGGVCEFIELRCDHAPYNTNGPGEDLYARTWRTWHSHIDIRLSFLFWATPLGNGRLTCDPITQHTMLEQRDTRRFAPKRQHDMQTEEEITHSFDYNTWFLYADAPCMLPFSPVYLDLYTQFVSEECAQCRRVYIEVSRDLTRILAVHWGDSGCWRALAPSNPTERI